MDEQQENLDRVSTRIAPAIIAFQGETGSTPFHADEMRLFVQNIVGEFLAPGSADRILRQLRQQGRLNYQVLSRSQSLYQFVPVEEEWLP